MRSNLKNRLSKFLSDLGIKIQNFAYLLDNPGYSQVKANKGDGGLYRLLNKEWFVNTKIDGILDVGVNEGQFIKTILFLLPNISIYGFEANPHLIKKLEENYANIKNVKIFPIACGSIQGFLPLNVSKFSPSSSLLKISELHLEEFPGTETEQVINVKVDRLDNRVKTLGLLHESFLLKIDVQGFELDVLKGATAIFDKVHIIVCEVNLAHLYENQTTFESLVSFLRHHKYQLVDIGKPIYSHRTHEILYIDLAFKKNI